MAKIIERTPEQIELDRCEALRARARLLERGRIRPGQCDVVPRAKLPAGAFDPIKAAVAAERARQEALADPDKSGYGKKTNIPSNICPKGQGGAKGGRGATNPKVIARNERRAKRRKR